MSLSLDLASVVASCVGQQFLPAKSLTAADPSGLAVDVRALSVDSVGLACEEIRLTAPSATPMDVDRLKVWAAQLCRRVAYLLETLDPLEFDAVSGQALIRSKTPSASPAGARYYEVVLSVAGASQFSLKRYEAVRGQPGRTQTPLTLTHELLAKLVNDLVDTLPKSP